MRMNELQQSPEATSWLASVMANLAAWWPTIETFFWKFMPAPLGALLMIVFDMPETRRQAFTRFSVSFLVSIIVGPVLFDFLHSFSLFSFLDRHNERHMGFVMFIAAGFGWTFLALLATYNRKARENPGAVIDNVKNVLKP
jgi:hypothetical protein